MIGSLHLYLIFSLSFSVFVLVFRVEFEIAAEALGMACIDCIVYNPDISPQPHRVSITMKCNTSFMINNAYLIIQTRLTSCFFGAGLTRKE